MKFSLSKYERELLTGELKFETSRSGGKGGQHVNKTESKVTLVFDLNESLVLSSAQKNQIFDKLESRISSDVLRISSSSNRSQYRNKAEVISRFFHLIEEALEKRKLRIPTKTPKSVKRKRLKNKKINKDKKNLRKKVRRGED